MGHLGNARRQPTNMRQLFYLGRAETPEASKTLEELPLALLADSRDLVQRRLEPRFPAQCPVVGQSETVGFVSHLLE